VYRARPAAEDLYDVECAYELIGSELVSVPQFAKRDTSGFLARDPAGHIVNEPESAGYTLARALGIGPDTLALVEGAGALDGRVERSLRRVLSAAFGARLPSLLAPVLDESYVRGLARFFVERVSALGPLPVLRIGPQPYGVIVVALSTLDDPDSASFEARLRQALDRLRTEVFAPAVDTVPRVGSAAASVDAGRTLIEILRTDGVARELRLRPLLGPSLAHVVKGLLSPREAEFVQRQRDSAAGVLLALGVDPPVMTLLDALLLPTPASVTAPLVASTEAVVGSRDAPDSYLGLLATRSSLTALARATYPEGRPMPLLFALGRVAVLESADQAARQILEEFGLLPIAWDAEVTDYQARPLQTTLGRLEARHPNPPILSFQTIGEHLDNVPTEPAAAVLRAVRSELDALRLVPPATLETALRGALTLLSHRLDAWYSGLAVGRLDTLRGKVRPRSRDTHGYREGVVLGGWGTVGRIPRSGMQVVPSSEAPASDPGPLYSVADNGGYIHAPSAAHAATAAVLRSTHLAHGGNNPFSVDLSSRRVRAAVEILDGVREGQPLGALLGYRIERALSDASLQRLIAPLRALAPPVAGRLTTGSAPAEAVAASNVVDGAELLELAGRVQGSPPQATKVAKLFTLGSPLTSAEVASFQAVLDDAADRLDAVGDLVLAEAVYQTVEGNAVRAGATEASVSGAPVPPIEPALLRRPRAGIAVTQRIGICMPPTPAHDAAWDATPRMQADPRLEALAAAVLPPPSAIRMTVRETATDATATDKTVTLAALLEAARADQRGELGLAALDVVLGADPNTAGARSGFDARLHALALVFVAPPAGSELTLLLERDATWSSDVWSITEVLEMARALRLLVTSARPLRPTDVTPLGDEPSHRADENELLARAAGARATLVTCRSKLSAATTGDAIRRALLAADQLGAAAVPSSDRDAQGAAAALAQLAQLRRDQAAVLRELDARIVAASDSSLTGIERLQAALGRGFPVVPRLLATSTAAGELLAATAANAQGRGASSGAVRAWMARATLHRPGAARLDAVLGYVEARDAGIVPPTTDRVIDVLQLPHVPNEPWIGGTGVPTAGRTTLVVAALDGPIDWKADLTGLVADEWVETVPSENETTSLAFHYDGPTSAAPQAALLCVEPEPEDGWSEAQVLAHIQEAIALAELRGVDLDLLEAGQILPPLISIDSSEGAGLGVELTEVVGP
jgi:hypothetical protein